METRGNGRRFRRFSTRTYCRRDDFAVSVSATWEELKAQNVDAVLRKSSKKLFGYGQTEPIEILGIFNAKITCNVTGVSCEDHFTVIKGKGTTLLSKGMADKLNVLCVRPVRSGIYSITSEGTDADSREQLPEVFSGIGKIADLQLKLHVNGDVKPVAQPVRRLPFGHSPGKANIADALSCLNQTTPCDMSGDTLDFVKMVAVESTPSALSAKQVELESEKDPELISVRQYVTTGDWSKCKLPHGKM